MSQWSHFKPEYPARRKGRGRGLWRKQLVNGSIKFRDGEVVGISTVRLSLAVAHIVSTRNFRHEECWVLLPTHYSRQELLRCSKRFLSTYRQEEAEVLWISPKEIDIIISMGHPLLAINYEGALCE